MSNYKKYILNREISNTIYGAIYQVDIYFNLYCLSTEEVAKEQYKHIMNEALRLYIRNWTISNFDKRLKEYD